MKIGKLTLETVEPNEVRLISSTGLSVAEMRRMLAGSISPSLIARGLNACLTEPMGVALLAREIAGDPDARFAVGALYGVVRKEPKRVKKGR
jgi:hypothetical protein